MKGWGLTYVTDFLFNGQHTSIVIQVMVHLPPLGVQPTEVR
jgi:hypothetical protein